MEIKIENIMDAAIVQVLISSLDISVSSDFKNRIAPVLKKNKYILFDLKMVQFIDSSGIGLIFWCWRELLPKKGELKIFNVSKYVQQALELVQIHKMLRIYSNREEALKSME